MLCRSGVVTAFVRQPFVQFLKTGKGSALGKETFPDDTDLILYLAFLPSGGGGAGNQIEEVVGCQVLEAAVEDSVFAHQYFGNYGLQVVVDTTATDTAKELESAGVGVKYHLQRFTGISNAERFTAVAKTKLSDLYFGLNTTQQQLFITPVKLKGVTGIIFKRDKGSD